MLVTRNLKTLHTYVAKETPAKAQARLTEIQSSLCVNYFNPTDSKYRQGLLSLVLQQVLPITCHENIQLRLQAESFIVHLSSLVSAFCPRSLSLAYSEFDASVTSVLQPAALASVFTLLANSLRSFSPEERFEQIGLCHSLLLSSKPELLTRVTDEVWILLRDSLDLGSRKGIIQLLIDSPLHSQVAILCDREPELFCYVAENASLNFLKELIPIWGKKHDTFFAHYAPKIIDALIGTDSGLISTALEVVRLVAKVMRNPPRESEGSVWKSIFEKIEHKWESATVSQKAKIIEVLATCGSRGMIDMNEMERFMSFKTDQTTVLSTSCIKAGAIFISKLKIIPDGFIDFLSEIAVDTGCGRDPLLYVAALKCLGVCFNEMYEVVPVRATRLLDFCLNPLPRDFIEQTAVVKMLTSIDWQRFSTSKLKTSITDIVLTFIREPHPSVMKRIPRLLQATNVVLPYTSLNWIEYGDAYLRVMPSDVYFVMELLDGGYITPAAYPQAIDVILDAESLSEDISRHLFNRALSVVLAALDALGIDIDGASSLKKYKCKNWKLYGDVISNLLGVMNDEMPSTPFGKIIGASLRLIASTMKAYTFTPNSNIGLVSMATVFGCSFTSVCCQIVRSVRVSDDKISAAVVKFFQQSFPYDHAVDVSLTAISCLDNSLMNQLESYFNIAVGISRKIIANYAFNESQCYNTFLALQKKPNKDKYMKKCIETLPFEQWIIEEEDFEYISSLSGVVVNDYDSLDEIHKQVVITYPAVFTVNHKTEEVDGSYFKHTIAAFVTLGGKVNGGDKDALIVESHVEPLPVPFSPYKSAVPSKADLFAFLWYSDRDVVSDDEWTQIENYALSINDYKFMSAFFGYGLRHKKTIKTDLWSKRIIVDRNNDDTCVAFCMFCQFLNKKWSELTSNELALVTSTLVEFGFHDSSPEFLIMGYKQQTGTRRMILESIIGIDPSRFAEFPVIEYLFSSSQHFWNHLDDILSLLSSEESGAMCTEAAMLFSQFVFPPTENSLIEQTRIPPHIPQMRRYLHSLISLVPFDKVILDEESVEKIVSFFESRRTYDQFMFSVVYHLNTSLPQYVRCLEPIFNAGRSHPLWYHVQMRIATKPGTTESVEVNENMPPSYTRQIVTFFLSPHAPNVNFVDQCMTLQKLRPVLFNLLPKGFEEFRAKCFDEEFPIVDECLLEIQPISAQAVARVKSIFENAPSFASRTLELIYQTSEVNLCHYFGTSTAGSAFMEIAQVAMQGICKRNWYMKDVIPVLKLLLDKIPLEEFFSLMMCDEFVNAENFAHVYTVLMMFSVRVNTYGNEALIEHWKEWTESLIMKFKNKKRYEIFNSNDPISALTSIYSID